VPKGKGKKNKLPHSVPKGPLGLVQGKKNKLPHSVPKGPLGLVQGKKINSKFPLSVE
jgi:hypothetical protein